MRLVPCFMYCIKVGIHQLLYDNKSEEYNGD